ncbi:CoA-binding protein [Alicyclobacillus sp.]|uniref:CoA-binding protein n=1 Tax=Alicyclobacillus sp. TaxID=61169 RepID=UPI0025BEB3EE|nr:CoA-binding protein [Alicyclobacillus sp.]MCL6517516.1 CoA-binding protein [Alicyclobacillus sp.]
MTVFQNPGPEQMRRILKEARTIAVVGLSDNPARDSYQVAQHLQRHGYRIIPVNPNVDVVLGEKAVAKLTDIREPVDIVDVFRRSEALKGVVEEALQMDAPVIWAQEGVYDEEAAALAEAHGRTMVMDRCIAVMHSLYARD